MQKKLMYGLALAAIAGGVFVACGSGDVSGATSEDKGNVFVYDDSYYAGLIESATSACAADAKCSSKANNTVPEVSSSSEGVTEPSSASVVSSSAAQILSSSSAAINFSSASVASSASTTVSSSSVEIVDDGTVNGTCAPVPAKINKGESTTWTFTQVTPAGMAGITKGAQAAYEWTMPGSDEGTANGTGLKTTTATYAESGSKTATLVVDGNTVACSELQVEGAAITGCECTADADKVDINGATATASWKVSGCTSDGATIIGYTWSEGVTGVEATGSQVVSARGEVTPTVTVSNDDGTNLDVTCQTVKVEDSTAPLYEISGTTDADTVTVAAGSCVTLKVAGNLRCGHQWQTTSCTISITYNGTTTVSVDDANCNNSNGTPVAVQAGTEACVTAEGADDTLCKVTNW
ncbi:MAG: hypothetical protein J6Z31_10550 [Fibrobacter sp.]|nr:hypothetical protein [Fibrobacter sp.]